MSRGMTIADFVQAVYYAIYKVRLDVAYDANLPQAFHADTDKFKEVVFEANLVLQNLQKDQDWNFLRDRWHMGTSGHCCQHEIAEFIIPRDIYKVSTGFNDAVRMHEPTNQMIFKEIPYTSPRSGTTHITAMFDQYGRLNVADTRIMAFVMNNILTFTRPFNAYELNKSIETDVIRYFDPLHICDSGCVQPCAQAYEDLVFLEIPDPYYMVVQTAVKRAEGDPSVSDRVMSLTDEATKLLSAMRENDSSKTEPDTYRSIELGFTRVL